MADIPRIKRNIQRMIDAGAPEADIDQYLSGEGVTLDQLKAPAIEQEGTASRMMRQFKNALIPGGDRLSALIGAGMDTISGAPESFGDLYDKRLKREWALSDQADRTAGAGDILAKTAGLTAGGFGLTRLPFLAAQAPVNTLWQASKESARVGAPIGALQAYLDSRSEDGTGRLADTGAGFVGGAAISGAVPAVMAGGRMLRNGGNALVEAMTGTRPAQREAMAARAAEMEAAGVPRDEIFGPALRDQPERSAVSLANSIGGRSLADSAQRNAGLVENALRGTIVDAGGTPGRAAGEDAQTFLRNQMFTRNVPDAQMAQQDRAGLLRYLHGGPLDAEYETALRNQGSQWAPIPQRTPGTTIADDMAAYYGAMDRSIPATNRGPIAVAGNGGTREPNEVYRLMEELRQSMRSRGLLPGDDASVPIFNSPAGGTFQQIMRRRFPAEIVDAIYARRPVSIQDLRRIRSEVRNMADVPPGQRTFDDAYLNRMEGALTTDMRGRLQRSGLYTGLHDMTRADLAYASYKNDIQAPLRKVFGENVTPEQAIRSLTSATQEGGDLQALRAFYNVAARKGDVRRVTSNIIGTMSQEGLPQFLESMRGLTPEARRIMFAGDAAPLGQALERLQRVAGYLEPYGNIGNRGNLPDMSRIPNITLAGTLLANVWAGVGLYAGQTGLAHFMASPRYVNWLTRAVQIQHNPNLFRSHVGKLMSMLKGDEQVGSEIMRGIGEVLRPGGANAAVGPEQASPIPSEPVFTGQDTPQSTNSIDALMRTPMTQQQQREFIAKEFPDAQKAFDAMQAAIKQAYPNVTPAESMPLGYDLDVPPDAPASVREAIAQFVRSLRKRSYPPGMMRLGGPKPDDLSAMQKLNSGTNDDYGNGKTAKLDQFSFTPDGGDTIERNHKRTLSDVTGPKGETWTVDDFVSAWENTPGYDSVTPREFADAIKRGLVKKYEPVVSPEANPYKPSQRTGVVATQIQRFTGMEEFADALTEVNKYEMGQNSTLSKDAYEKIQSLVKEIIVSDGMDKKSYESLRNILQFYNVRRAPNGVAPFSLRGPQ